MRDEAEALINQVLAGLFNNQMKRLDRRLSSICRAQSEITGKPCPAFLYNGNLFIDKESPIITSRGERPGLLMELSPMMQLYRVDKDNVCADYAQIKQLLFKLLYQCNDQQEMHDALPDCVHHLTQLNGLQRYRMQESHMYEDRTRNDFVRILPKIHFYLASALVNN